MASPTSFPRLPIVSFFGTLISVSQVTHPKSRTRTPTLPKEIRRILRFGIVGGAGTLLNALLMWGLLSLANTFLGLDPGGHRLATAAAFVAWIVCCGTNFLLNAAWTFRAWPPSWGQAKNYYLSAALAFLFQIFLLNLLLFLLETDRPIETAVLNAVAVATGSLLNYLFASLWVFRR
ncbi:MAG: GtrA family protein [Verrucomicrobia bacterium]|nr:GtrA family protein [Pseudomonadota bacterium]NBS06304.1 GtrA family protein [Verrucomicrobiota bacterium]NBS78957.1 GtrA family protein [bacterium]NBS49342.1 GtrA family protein [Verrucomicrobiota bacterium]NBV96223.1 GtrA family protein [Verrucomicrobiota bacterium]